VCVMVGGGGGVGRGEGEREEGEEGGETEREGGEGETLHISFLTLGLYDTHYAKPHPSTEVEEDVPCMCLSIISVVCATYTHITSCIHVQNTPRKYINIYV